MRLTHCTFAPYRLPLRQLWVSARGGFVVREGWLVRLETDAGLTGYGDCAPLPQAGTESMDSAVACLSDWATTLPGLPLEVALGRITAGAAGAPAACCGLETALLDLLAQQAGLPLARWLNSHSSAAVKVNAVIGGLDSQIVERALAAVAEGYSVLKLKVGLAAGHEEIPLLHNLVSCLPAGVSLRLDANCAWNEGQAEVFLSALTGLPVESVEDPLVNPDMAGWLRLQAKVPFPLAADESLRIMGVDAAFNQPPVWRVVLKPMVLGGLVSALALAQRAREAGVECVVTTTVDSAVGVSAALHLAAAVANNLAHGLATSAWLESDVVNPPRPTSGVLRLGDSPGLGCVPSKEFEHSVKIFIG
ncbi:L-alanine-DL-glutamate epimerase [Sulfuricella denitrificans skB26]|uniref:o-succinylbenzoate synthase n=1 Tax=Sulfuricella denitrificans (strain DSM 22764 / NBRC 105220 / skB26) TaxID=1163617 RepID=S6B0F7_SULDS|nr:o-succinylbenzoate synthase [Sulfuricella denitrificans]BAN34197.1 L-alanine-DL-glutamate epimerase [Sulfuricella denitrificans skB26]